MIQMSLIIMIITSFAILPMINVEGEEKYNLAEKACPNYEGEWNDKIIQQIIFTINLINKN
jgi:hypothetical protein